MTLSQPTDPFTKERRAAQQEQRATKAAAFLRIVSLSKIRFREYLPPLHVHLLHEQRADGNARCEAENAHYTCEKE